MNNPDKARFNPKNRFETNMNGPFRLNPFFTHYPKTTRVIKTQCLVTKYCSTSVQNIKRNRQKISKSASKLSHFAATSRVLVPAAVYGSVLMLCFCFSCKSQSNRIHDPPKEKGVVHWAESNWYVVFHPQLRGDGKMRGSWCRGHCSRYPVAMPGSLLKVKRPI